MKLNAEDKLQEASIVLGWEVVGGAGLICSHPIHCGHSKSSNLELTFEVHVHTCKPFAPPMIRM